MQIATATPFVVSLPTRAPALAHAVPARISAARWLIDFPPLYVATIALVAGDALGNAGLYVPIGVALGLALAAAAAYMCARPQLGVANAFLAIGASAPLPVRDLNLTPSGQATQSRFVDDSKVTIEGEIVREP